MFWQILQNINNSGKLNLRTTAQEDDACACTVAPCRRCRMNHEIGAGPTTLTAYGFCRTTPGSPEAVAPLTIANGVPRFISSSMLFCGLKPTFFVLQAAGLNCEFHARLARQVQHSRCPRFRARRRQRKNGPITWPNLVATSCPIQMRTHVQFGFRRVSESSRRGHPTCAGRPPAIRCLRSRTHMYQARQVRV